MPLPPDPRTVTRTTTTRHIATVALIAAIASIAGTSIAQSRASSTRATATTTPAQKFTISDLSLLAGAWRGSIGEDTAEEHWSTPAAGMIMGMFRWVGADDSVNLVEMLTIAEQDDGIYLRLIHYNTQLVASESEPITLKLASIANRTARFEPVSSDGPLASISYDRSKDNSLVITVAFKSDSNRAPLVFKLKRADVKRD